MKSDHRYPQKIQREPLSSGAMFVIKQIVANTKNRVPLDCNFENAPATRHVYHAKKMKSAGTGRLVTSERIRLTQRRGGAEENKKKRLE
jgi:hypothetical protein